MIDTNGTDYFRIMFKMLTEDEDRVFLLFGLSSPADYISVNYEGTV